MLEYRYLKKILKSVDKINSYVRMKTVSKMETVFKLEEGGEFG